MKSRAVFLVGLTAAILLGTALRLHTRSSAVRGDTVEPLDSDSAYHMRRARFAAANFPRTILFDPLMNFPSGGVAIWPPLFDLALAAPARLEQGAHASADAVARGAAWVPVALAAVAIVLAGLLGRALYGPAAGAAAALFLAVCPGHVLWSQYAHTDQHVAESVCGLAVLLAYVRSRSDPDSPGGARRDAAVGTLLAIAVLTWQGAIYWGAIVALSLVLERLRTGRTVAREAAWMLAFPAALTGLATALWWSGFHPPLTYVSFGFFQPLFLAAMAGGVAAADLLITTLRGEPARDDARRLIPVLVLAGSLLATLPFARELVAATLNGVLYSAGTTREVAGGMGYLSYPKNWLHGIFEARPLLADGPGLAWRQLSAAFFLAPVAVLAWIARAIRGERPGIHLALGVWGGVTLFLALSQRLDVYYAAPLAALTLIEAARFVAARVPQRPRRAAVVAAGVGLLLAFPMAGGIADELRTRYVPGSDFFDTLARLRAATSEAVDADAYDPRLLGPPPFPPALERAQAVLAPWSAGHWILYEAERPVVANNFGYGFFDSIRFFLSESETEALALAKRRRARWILMTDLTPRLNDYASYLGKPPLVAGEGQNRTATPAYFRTMQARLYEFDGKGAESSGLHMAVEPVAGVRLLFHSQSAIQIRHGDRWVALWKVFEIVDQGAAPGGGP